MYGMAGKMAQLVTSDWSNVKESGDSDGQRQDSSSWHTNIAFDFARSTVNGSFAERMHIDHAYRRSIPRCMRTCHSRQIRGEY